MVFLWWCGCVFVVVCLRFCGGVFVFLWWCGCVFGGVALWLWGCVFVDKSASTPIKQLMVLLIRINMGCSGNHPQAEQESAVGLLILTSKWLGCKCRLQSGFQVLVAKRRAGISTSLQC